eukprot:jgi/Orpsp1_1/1182389/evm.model.c7180000081096.1
MYLFSGTGKSKYLPKDISSPLIPHYKSVFLRADPKTPGMRGLFIGVHSSCSFYQEPFLYKYIISVNITSFWNQKYTIGNIYFPQNKWKEARLIAFNELSQWLRFHNKDNVPAILIGDFNMSLKKITTYISNNFPNWSIAPLYGNVTNLLMQKVLDHLVLIMLFSIKLWRLTLIRHQFVIHFMTPITYTLTADEMVEKFINTSNNIGKDIKAFIPTDLKGSAFHCPFYIKKLSHEKHIAFQNIKPFFNCENVDKYLEQFNKYEKLCKLIKKVKSKFRSARWAEYYQDLASDPSGHSLDRNYWNYTLRNICLRTIYWDINGPITVNEIKNIISSMKNNKAPGLDDIPIEFYKALFCNDELEEIHPAAGKCLELIFNKIWNGSFPKKWNSASLVSIPKKGDLTDCSNYR